MLKGTDSTLCPFDIGLSVVNLRVDDIGVVVAFIGAERVAVDPGRCENVVSFAESIVVGSNVDLTLSVVNFTVEDKFDIVVSVDACITVVSEWGVVGFGVDI